jgi:hypothetical protein
VTENSGRPAADDAGHGVRSQVPGPSAGLTSHHREGAPVTNTQPITAPTDCDPSFASVVRDILIENLLIGHSTTNETIESLVEQIDDAYRPRISHEKKLVLGLHQQVKSLYARDEVMSHHMDQLHEGHAKTVVSRDRYATRARVVDARLEKIGAAICQAADKGSDTVATAEIAAILQSPYEVPPQQRPMALTFVSGPDPRWHSGVFNGPSGAVMCQLVGWSVVMRGRSCDSVIEPVFRVNGQQHCQSEMELFHQLTLNHLL